MRKNESALVVQWALDSRGQLVRPANASRNEEYVCAKCHCAVDVREGSRVQRHFAHRRDSMCTQTESDLHRFAKDAIAAAVALAANGRLSFPSLVRRCSKCGQTQQQPIPSRVRSASVEATVPGLSRRADVGLFDACGAMIAALEVRVSHRVDEEKAAELQTLHVPWFEIDASAPDLPHRLMVLREGNAKHLQCRACAAAVADRRAEVDAQRRARRAPTLRVAYEVLAAPSYGYLRSDDIKYSITCPIDRVRVDPVFDCASCEYLLESVTGTLRIRGVRPGGFEGICEIRCGYSSSTTQSDLPELERFFRSTARLLSHGYETFMAQEETEEDDYIWDLNRDIHDPDTDKQ